MSKLAEFTANELLIWRCLCATGDYGVAGCLHCPVRDACVKLDEVLDAADRRWKAGDGSYVETDSSNQGDYLQLG